MIVASIAGIFYGRGRNSLTRLPYSYNIFKRLTGNTIAFILTAIYYIIREYRTRSKGTDNFYSTVVSG